MIERSFGLDLAAWLAAEGRRVFGWDPLAIEEARDVFDGVIAFARSAEKCLSQSTVVIVINQ
jgi:hypothetical protein